jgi:signal transduction histidine kinase
MDTQSPVNILMVDDHPENLLALEAILGDLGHNLVKAASGREALRHLLAEEFALILLDAAMPEMDGYETAELIRSREKTRKTPIIFLTADYKSESQVFKGYAVGAIDYLLKPYVPEVLRSKVTAFVELYTNRRLLKEEAEALRRARDTLEDRVRERTAELASANRALQAEIVERRRAEEERAVMFEREKAARVAAESINRVKDEFLATLSHELRTPMNAILGWTHILGSGAMSEEKLARAVSIIKSNSLAQVQLIDELLDVSRMISGRTELNVEALDARSVVEAVLESARPAAEAKGIRFETSLDPIPPLACDRGRLRQIVWNILSNAIKFTPKDGEVSVRLHAVNGEVVIVVSDTGIGMDPAFLPHVFERFTQADSSAKRAHGGLGLGMAIVRHLVELHSGTVHVASAGENQGATFTVRLPIPTTCVVAGEPLGTRRHEQEEVSLDELPMLEGVSVLIVDDEPNSREVAASILSQRGARVTVVGSAREAVDAVAEAIPDVLVSDIGMPGEDGYSLIRKIRSLEPERGGQIPAIALTAYVSARDSLAALAAGYHRHVAKPIVPAELVNAVAELRAFSIRPA